MLSKVNTSDTLTVRETSIALPYLNAYAHLHHSHIMEVVTLLTILSRVRGYYFGVRAPAGVVLGLNFDFVKDERRRVLNNKRMPLLDVLHPVFGSLSSVAHFILQTRSIVFDG